MRPLLIFDSGVGGLSVLKPIRTLLPTAPIVYVADSAGYPYGVKSAAEIAARVPALLGRLSERLDPELIVIACNTASTIALDAVRAALDVPRSNGSRRFSDLITVSSRSWARSKVVKRAPQSSHCRRRRIAEPSSAGRLSFTWLSSWPQNGQRMSAHDRR